MKSSAKSPDTPPAEIGSTRDRAVEAADALLVSGGYAAMSLEAVAQAIGIRKPSLYHHFPRGKNELFIAVVEHRTKSDGEMIAKALRKPSTTSGRLRAIARHFEHVVQTRPYHALYDAANELPVEHRDFARRMVQERVMAPVHEVISNGMALGDLRACDAELAALSFISMMVMLSKVSNDDPRRPQLPDFIVNLFIEGLRPRSQER